MRNACPHVNERAVMGGLGKFLVVDVGCVLLKYYIRRLALGRAAEGDNLSSEHRGIVQ